MHRLLTAFTALALAACTTAPAPTLELSGNRLFVAAKINSVPVSALLDSAAEMSFVDSNWAKANGLAAAGTDVAKGSGGTADVSFAEHVSIEALGAHLDDTTIAVLDLSDISRRLVGRPVTFILGREIFDKQRLAIDIEAGSITATDRDNTPPGISLPLTGARGIESFPAHVNGQPIAADFDLGNGTDIMISTAMAEKLGLLNDPSALETRKGGGIGGELVRKIVRLKTLEIGGVTFDNIEAAIDGNDSAGDLNVGVSVLRRFRITTDFEQRRIWLAPR